MKIRISKKTSENVPPAIDADERERQKEYMHDKVLADLLEDERIPNKITEDDKFFAHISNDSAMTDSGLAGHNEEAFCKYLLKLTQDLDHPDVNMLAADILRPLNKQLTLIQQTAEATTVEEGLKLITKASISAKGESIAFVSGWSGWSGWSGTVEYNGHSIIAQLQFDADGDLVLIIHNTGDGINYHTRRPDWKGTSSATELVYKLRKAEATPKNVQYL